MMIGLGLRKRLGLLRRLSALESTAIISRGGWWTTPENVLDSEVPSAFLDFVNNRYVAPETGHTPFNTQTITLDQALTVSNASTLRTYCDSSGVLRVAPPNTPRIDYSSGEGRLLLTGFFIHKCRANTIAPNTSNWTLSGAAGATLTVVNDATQLASAGLNGLVTAGNVYKLDNSAGVTTATAAAAGTTDNGNTHVASAYARVFSGSGGAVEVSGSGSTAFSNTIYRRVDCVASPTNTTRTFAITAAAGSVIYFILPNLVEAPQPMPIVPDTVTVSSTFVTGDVCRLGSDVAAAFQGPGTAVAWRGNIPTTFAGLQLVGLTGGALLRTGTSTIGQITADGRSSGVPIGTANTPAPGDLGACMGFGASGRNVSANSGAVVSDANPVNRSLDVVGLGPVNGLLTGQIISVSQLVVWSFADRPSDSGIQTQAIQDRALTPGYVFLKALGLLNKYEFLTGLLSSGSSTRTKLQGKRAS